VAIICPTITAEEKVQYLKQLNIVSGLSNRLHIDVSDQSMAPRKLLALNELSWPAGLSIDLHLMVDHPAIDLTQLISLRPSLVIIHAESKDNFKMIARQLHNQEVKFGLALLPESPPDLLTSIIDQLDHVMIFSGNLGYQGGSVADLKLLSKVKWLKQTRPELEIGWDGGINDQNILSLVQGGINVLNVGGYIQNSESPKQAYAKLSKARQINKNNNANDS